MAAHLLWSRGLVEVLGRRLDLMGEERGGGLGGWMPTWLGLGLGIGIGLGFGLGLGVGNEIELGTGFGLGLGV